MMLKMTSLFWFCSIILIGSTDFQAFSQLTGNQIGGRALGVAGATVTYQDVWAQQHNQAGLAYLKGITVGAGFKNAFFIKELSTKSIAFGLPLKSGVVGLNYHNYGYSKYNENKIGLAFSKLLGKKIALGIQLDYLYTSIEEYGQKGIAAGEIGLIAEPVDDLYIGAHVFNLWNEKRSINENEYLPTIFKLGTSYHLYKKAILSLEAEKDLEMPLLLKAGLELELVKDFFVRAGINGLPASYSFGMAYTFQSFELNIAFAKHHLLGYSPGISINYAFKNRL